MAVPMAVKLELEDDTAHSDLTLTAVTQQVDDYEMEMDAPGSFFLPNELRRQWEHPSEMEALLASARSDAAHAASKVAPVPPWRQPAVQESGRCSAGEWEVDWAQDWADSVVPPSPGLRPMPTPAPSPCSNLQPEPQGVGAAQLPHPVRDPVGVQCTQQVPEGGGDSWAPGGSWGYPQGSSSGAASSWGYPQGSSSSGASAVPRSKHGWAQCWVRREDRKLRPSGRTGERGGKSQKWFGGKFGDKGWGTASGEQPWCYPKRRREHR
jgi:hypothetical protein